MRSNPVYKFRRSGRRQHRPPLASADSHRRRRLSDRYAGKSQPRLTPAPGFRNNAADPLSHTHKQLNVEHRFRVPEPEPSAHQRKNLSEMLLRKASACCCKRRGTSRWFPLRSPISRPSSTLARGPVQPLWTNTQGKPCPQSGRAPEAPRSPALSTTLARQNNARLCIGRPRPEATRSPTSAPHAGSAAPELFSRPSKARRIRVRSARHDAICATLREFPGQPWPSGLRSYSRERVR